jgi:arabinose-5-phosphate isomerase
MNDQQKIIDKGREVIRIEAREVASLLDRIGNEFAHAVDLIYRCKGRVIVTGVGKSGIIARKIVATMNSTGTQAVFLHPTDAVHGDLGIVREGDVVICISKSGATKELTPLVPMFQRLGVPIISMVGNASSPLARESTVVLDASVTEEACPHDLAPTSSTTVDAVLGDAIAIALLERRQFTREDFARYHPGGTLGRRLLLKVDELMVRGKDIPSVKGSVTLRDAIVEMTTKRLGCTCVVGDEGRLEGVITDGDLRRLLQKTPDISRVSAAEVMSRQPKTVSEGTLAMHVLQVVDAKQHPTGVVHLHDLVKAGLGGDDQG